MIWKKGPPIGGPFNISPDISINPLMMLIVGAVVGVLVMSIYGPITSVSSSLG